MHIGLNAHLLSAEKGYRSAGIHGYIYNVLAHLAAAAPEDWRFTAMVGQKTQHTFSGIDLRHAPLDTQSPIRRIVWEQTIQPWMLAPFDLYHALAFVSPLILTRSSVVTVYDLSFIHYPQLLTPARRLYLRLFTRLSCQRARRVIAISQSTARDLHTTLDIPLGKIDVSGCGYDVRRYRPLPATDIETFRRWRGLPERFWLFLGTLEPRKNLPTLLDAYARLPESERLPLFLAGAKGWMYDDIFQRIEQHGLAGSVHLPGFVPAEELPLWYNSAEVLVYPSVFEGFGLPVLEAMACGTPVIVSDASSLPEVAGNAGKCIPAHDIYAWTEALRSAYRDADWRQEASRFGMRQAASFTWENTARQIVRSYQLAVD